MEKISLSPRTLALLRIWSAIIKAPLFAVLFLFYEAAVWWFLCGAALLFAALLFIFWYLPRYVSGYKITATKNYISVERGVFIRKEIIMPQPRYIYARKITTVLSARFSLCLLVFSATRGFLVLPPIEKEAADEILRLLDGG